MKFHFMNGQRDYSTFMDIDVPQPKEFLVILGKISSDNKIWGVKLLRTVTDCSLSQAIAVVEVLIEVNSANGSYYEENVS